MRVPRPRPALLAVAAVAVAAAAVATVLVSDDHAAAAACPPLAEEIWTDELRKGPKDTLATPGARSVVVCEYASTTGPVRTARTFDATGKPGKAPSTGRRIAESIVAVTPRPPEIRGGPVCLHDTAERYVVLLRYGSHTEAVTIGRSLCRIVSNGSWRLVYAPPSPRALIDEALA